MAILTAIWLTSGFCAWLQSITEDRPIGDGTNPRLLSWKEALTVALPVMLIFGPLLWFVRVFKEFAYYGANE